ncbi:hypothetical protein CDD82_7074 [Ophiocordyceps australis]|uniref:Tyrosinase copper-binding domain-containing protein n=1 Tax=Ophiocordyceps australis TaxID=1399860 RepID=A0A2C5Y2F8_9HYPO|nr:hypothetical protein CDD82_7074 [Ophiocordyceps australis]
MFRPSWALWLLGLCIALCPLPGHANHPPPNSQATTLSALEPTPEPTPGPSRHIQDYEPQSQYLWAARWVARETMRHPLTTRSYANHQPPSRFETMQIYPVFSSHTLVLHDDPLKALRGFLNHMRSNTQFTTRLEMYLIQWTNDRTLFRDVREVCPSFPKGLSFCIQYHLPIPLHAFPIHRRYVDHPERWPISEKVVDKILDQPGTPTPH